MARMCVRLAFQQQAFNVLIFKKEMAMLMTRCTFRENIVFLVSMRFAILMVTHMITDVQTAAQLVLGMKHSLFHCQRVQFENMGYVLQRTYDKVVHIYSLLNAIL